jgi:hypothetical protein
MILLLIARRHCAITLAQKQGAGSVRSAFNSVDWITYYTRSAHDLTGADQMPAGFRRDRGRE